MQEEQRKMFKETMERERQREEREKLRYEASIHVKDVRSMLFAHIFGQIFYFPISASYFISSGKFRFYNADKTILK